MIHVIADSTFGITKEYAEANDIKIVNLKLILDGVITDEGFQEDWPEFYQRYRTSKSFPTTSQPNSEDFKKQIDSIYSKDKDAEIIILTISNALSGTINSATIATRDYAGKKIIAIDSDQACTCGRLMVEEIVEFIKSKMSYERIINEGIPLLKEKLKIQFVPENMDALKRGGRVGTLAATLATILKIKPIFCFKKGMIAVTKKTLGLGHAIADMVSALPKQLKKLYICYIDDKSLIDAIKNRLNIMKIKCDEIVAVDPVFGAHVGIGSVGLASLEEYTL